MTTSPLKNDFAVILIRRGECSESAPKQNKGSKMLKQVQHDRSSVFEIF